MHRAVKEQFDQKMNDEAQKLIDSLPLVDNEKNASNGGP